MDKNQVLNWAIAYALKETRESAGLSQTQLADFAGLSEKYISKAERGTIGVSVAALVQIATVLKIEPAEIMRRIDAEMKRGPHRPEGKIGRPQKRRSAPAHAKMK